MSKKVTSSSWFIKTIALAVTLCSSFFLYGQIETVLQQGHRMHVICSAFSPNEKLLASGSRDRTIKLWDIQTGREIRTFAYHLGSINHLQFHSNGTELLSSGNDNRIIIQNILSANKMLEIKVDCDRLLRAVYDPTYQYILASDNHQYIYVYSIQTKELIGKYKKPYSAPIHPAWFSPDGENLVIRGERKQVHIINIVSEDTLQTFTFDLPRSYCFSPDGKELAIGSVKLFAETFDIETGKMLHHLENSEGIRCQGCNTDVRYSKSGKYIVTASSKSGVVLWNARNGKEIRTFTKEDERVDDVFFSPRDKYLAIVRDDETLVFNTNTGKLLIHSKGDKMDGLSAFSKSGKYFSFCGTKSRIELWNPATGKRISYLSGYLNSDESDKKFKESNWFQSYIVQDLNIKTIVALSPDGKKLLKGKIDSVFVQIDLETGKVSKQFGGHTGEVISLTYSSDGKYFASGDINGKIIVWDSATGKQLDSYQGGNNVIFDLDFSNDNQKLLSSSYDAYLNIRDFNTHKTIKYSHTQRAEPYCSRFTPNDLYIIKADRAGKVNMLESDACEVFRSIVGHTDIVNDIDFTADSRYIVTAGRDGKVKVWDMFSGMQICRFSKHTGAVHAVATDPLGRFVASAGDDKDIKLWNPLNGKMLDTLSGHSSAVTSLKISQDGKRLVSCSIDGIIKVWDMNNFREEYTYIQINRDEWLSTVSSGYLDGSSQALKMVNYVSGTAVLPVGSLFKKFYTPGLIKRLHSGEKFEGSSTQIQNMLEDAPEIQLAVISENSRSLVHKTDSIEWYKENFPLQVELKGRGKGVNETRVYSNNKLVIRNEEKVKLKKGKSVTQDFTVPLVAGINNIHVITVNEDNTESAPVEISVFYDGTETVSDLYIISIGINKYENPSYNLSYAVNDAKICSKNIAKRSKIIFGKTEEYFIKDKHANKRGIDSVFKEVIKKAQPTDVFLFHFAGHGAMSMGSIDKEAEFYIIPTDVTQLYGNDKQLEDKAISASELLAYSQQIKAGKQMFIIDACQSGGAVNTFAMRGANREKAIAQLARSSGTFFLLASGAMQFASEAKELGHGLFSYSILEAINGKADGGKLDKHITVGELKSYVENRVPELSQKYMLTPQYPTGYSFGQDFPIVIVK